MPQPKVSLTTKDVATLLQLEKSGQLKLQPDFQREGVWPKAAKSYFIDSILNGRPIPPIYIQRTTSVQTGRSEFAVIDGQQRIRAIQEFLDDGLKLNEVGDGSVASTFKGKKFSGLSEEMQQRLWNFDFVVQELSGYSEDNIRDIFARMNKYVVKLSKQELRHAQKPGKFKDFVERIAKWPFWKQERVFTRAQLARMRAAEFAAEIAILLSEGGPQHKKTAIDLYYHRYSERFREGSSLEATLRAYISWIQDALPNLRTHRYRRSNELYALIGALDIVSKRGSRLSKLDPSTAGQKLLDFEKTTQSKTPKGSAAQYVIAASKHTDDLQTRTTRIEILQSLLS
jgi:Protein of unknown function DUF262